MTRFDLMLIIICVGLVILLSLMHNPTYASGSCRTYNCEDQEDRTIYKYINIKDDDGAKRALEAIGWSALGACVGTSLYQGTVNNDWRFCWNYFEWSTRKSGKAKDDGRITPDNLSDKPFGVRLYQ